MESRSLPRLACAVGRKARWLDAAPGPPARKYLKGVGASFTLFPGTLFSGNFYRTNTQSLLLHELGHSRNRGIFSPAQRSHHVCLILFAAILAQLELRFEFRYGNLKTDNLLEHVLAELFVQPGPLRGVRRFECIHQLVQDDLQVLRRGI